MKPSDFESGEETLAFAAEGGCDQASRPPACSPARRSPNKPLPLPIARADDATSLLEASHQITISDVQKSQRDADFFNAFEDDADESDMKPTA